MAIEGALITARHELTDEAWRKYCKLAELADNQGRTNVLHEGDLIVMPCSDYRELFGMPRQDVQAYLVDRHNGIVTHLPIATAHREYYRLQKVRRHFVPGNTAGFI